MTFLSVEASLERNLIPEISLLCHLKLIDETAFGTKVANNQPNKFYWESIDISDPITLTHTLYRFSDMTIPQVQRPPHLPRRHPLPAHSSRPWTLVAAGPRPVVTVSSGGCGLAPPAWVLSLHISSRTAVIDIMRDVWKSALHDHNGLLHNRSDAGDLCTAWPCGGAVSWTMGRLLAWRCDQKKQLGAPRLLEMDHGYSNMLNITILSTL